MCARGYVNLAVSAYEFVIVTQQPVPPSRLLPRFVCWFVSKEGSLKVTDGFYCRRMVWGDYNYRLLSLSVCRSGLSVTLSTKSTKFGRRDLVDRLLEGDEFRHVVSLALPVHVHQYWD